MKTISYSFPTESHAYASAHLDIPMVHPAPGNPFVVGSPVVAAGRRYRDDDAGGLPQAAYLGTYGGTPRIEMEDPAQAPYYPSGPSAAGGNWGGSGNGIFNTGIPGQPFSGQLIPNGMGLPIGPADPFATNTPGPAYYQIPGVPEPSFMDLEPGGGYPSYTGPDRGPYGNGEYYPAIGSSPSYYGTGFLGGDW